MTDARGIARQVEDAHRRHWSAVLAATVRVTRNLDLAEDCAQDAFLRALRVWPDDMPRNPAAWLTTVARRVALDRLRREETLRRKLPLLVMDEPGDDEHPTDPLRLVFTCCHPALSREAKVALTLRLMCGLTTPEVAAGLLISESTAAARITRAKTKIAAAGIPFRIPSDVDLSDRLDAVLTVVHLVFTAGHTATGDSLARADLMDRAIDLGRMLVQLLPKEPEARALLALLLMTRARGDARTSEDGALILLSDQDRSRWDHALIDKGLALATAALKEGDGRFTLQAAIAGLHVSARTWEGTDWAQVVRMYDALLQRWPSPIVALNRAAARSLAPGADLTQVLAEIEALEPAPELRRYAYLPATKADVLARLGRSRPAAGAYGDAIRLCTNETERQFLQRRRSSLG